MLVQLLPNHKRNKALKGMKIIKTSWMNSYQVTISLDTLEYLNVVLRWKRHKTYKQLAEDHRFELKLNIAAEFEEEEIKEITKNITEKANVNFDQNNLKIANKTSPYDPDDSYYEVIYTTKSDKEVEAISKVALPIQTKKGRAVVKSIFQVQS